MAEVSWWFLENGLLLNPSKTEAIVFGTRQRLVRKKARFISVNVSDVTVNFVDALKLLGVTFDRVDFWQACV